MFAYENKRVILNYDIDKLNVINFLHVSRLLETRELTKTYKLKFNKVQVRSADNIKFLCSERYLYNVEKVYTNNIFDIGIMIFYEVTSLINALLAI